MNKKYHIKTCILSLVLLTSGCQFLNSLPDRFSESFYGKQRSAKRKDLNPERKSLVAKSQQTANPELDSPKQEDLEKIDESAQIEQSAVKEERELRRRRTVRRMELAGLR
jgi:hypothetical protein